MYSLFVAHSSLLRDHVWHFSCKVRFCVTVLWKSS